LLSSRKSVAADVTGDGHVEFEVESHWHPMTAHEHGAVWQPSAVDRARRWAALGSHGLTVWMTGLSGAGKSTLAEATLVALTEAARPAYILDADNLRHGLNRDLGFSPADRSENARRVAEVALAVADAGLICLVPIISPYRADRTAARLRHEENGLPFMEVFVDASVAVCTARDTKGLYRRNASGTLTGLTGVDAPYEAPLVPDVHLLTDSGPVEPMVIDILHSIDALIAAIQ
jgi:adenylyl-sulfate kinase